MQIDSDVNPAYDVWKSSTGREKEWNLQELIRRLEKYGTAICYQRLPDHQSDFAALVNGIVWTAINHVDQFKGRSKFSTWFYRIVVNACNRYLTNIKKQCEAPLEEELPAKPEGADAKIDVIAILDGLQGDDHVLFRMVAEGQEFKDIAAKLRISRNAAIVRWTRLKEKLRDAR